ELMGTVIDPLGNPIFSTKSFTKPKQERELDQDVKGIAERSRVKEPLKTGVTLIDMMIPLGKGQKELLIGNRKTGKTSVLISIIKSQIQQGIIPIYTLIAKQQTDIKNLQQFFLKEGILDKCIIVASTVDDSPGLIFITPLTAFTIAEYFRDNGQDTVVILDDLSAHAKLYRQFSLLAKRFPGRESYPGDIFYTHAKLLERSGNFHHESGKDVSISCFPIVETVDSDLTAYISTNIMGMTDGHIFFDSNAFFQGHRPAINIPLSVSRVGKQTQSVLKRQITTEATLLLTQYEKMKNFSHFGAELSDKSKQILNTGEQLFELFNQHYSEVIPEDIQILMFGLVWKGFNAPEISQVSKLKKQLMKVYENKDGKKLIETMVQVENIPDLLKNITNKGKELFSYIT
nr:F0F1 ATP synthase subunit alpha [Patescibacteria group bacterium]